MSQPDKVILVYSLLALYSISPLLSVLLASTIAKANGCKLDEAGANPCLIGGKDWGKPLTAMFVMGWFLLVTVPTGALGIIGYSVFLLISRGSK